MMRADERSTSAAQGGGAPPRGSEREGGESREAEKTEERIVGALGEARPEARERNQREKGNDGQQRPGPRPKPFEELGPAAQPDLVLEHRGGARPRRGRQISHRAHLTANRRIGANSARDRGTRRSCTTFSVGILPLAYRSYPRPGTLVPNTPHVNRAAKRSSIPINLRSTVPCGGSAAGSWPAGSAEPSRQAVKLDQLLITRPRADDGPFGTADQDFGHQEPRVVGR